MVVGRHQLEIGRTDAGAVARRSAVAGDGRRRLDRNIREAASTSRVGMSASRTDALAGGVSEAAVEAGACRHRRRRWRGRWGYRGRSNGRRRQRGWWCVGGLGDALAIPKLLPGKASPIGGGIRLRVRRTRNGKTQTHQNRGCGKNAGHGETPSPYRNRAPTPSGCNAFGHVSGPAIDVKASAGLTIRRFLRRSPCLPDCAAADKTAA